MRAALVTACVLAIAGCHAPAVKQASPASNERTSTAAPAQNAADAAPTALEAIREFATAYINWSAATVTEDMRSLAARSVGQARAAVQLAAAQTAGDYELQGGGVSNSGTVEAIAPLTGHANQYVVVTRELTSATNSTMYEGLRPAWHVALATVTELGSGSWALSGWQPES